jgi:ubiquinone/menaquinone biosynthesis C-methylase UbiE
MATAPANAAQAENWNGTVGATWVDYQAQLDRQLDPLGQAAMRALAPGAGECVLDIGCGCGHTSLQLAELVGPSGAVLGLDISGLMLDVARRRGVTTSGGRIEFREADAQTCDLGRGSFDAAYSRFGVMFFGDPVAALANIRAALKPNGRLGFVCWRSLADNPWMREPFEAVRPLLPAMAAADPLAPGPFAFADPDRVRGLLREAGFAAVTTEAFDCDIGGDDLAATVNLTLRVGPLGFALREHPALRDAVKATVAQTLRAHLTPRGVYMRAGVWVVQARVN